MLDKLVKQGLVPRVVDREQAAWIVKNYGGSVAGFFKAYTRRDQLFDTRDICNFLGV